MPASPLPARVLVYGFGPYGDFADNVTASLLAALRPRPGLATRVFEVRFDRAMFEAELERVQPAAILGLGQHPQRELKIERRARNLRAERGEAPVPIEPGGPPELSVNWDLPLAPGAIASFDAGAYVCNFSIFVCCRWCERRGGRFAFLHVPRELDFAACLGYVERRLDEALAPAAAPREGIS